MLNSPSTLYSPEHNYSVNHVEFSLYSSEFLSASSDGNVIIWDSASGLVVHLPGLPILKLFNLFLSEN